MKKSQLRQIIEEEIKYVLNESSNILSKEFGGYDDKEFLKIVWKLSIPELENLLNASKIELNWLKNQGPKGKIMGLFNRRDISIMKNRIEYLNGIISDKKKNPDFIPDFVK